MKKRRSLRLPNYDYAGPGAYFVTICTQNNKYLFGDVIIRNKIGIVDLNPAGEMVKDWWYKLAEKFTTVEAGSFVVMPNHFHGIVHLRRGRPTCLPDACRSTCLSGDDHCNDAANEQEGGHTGPFRAGGHTGPPLPRVMQWFKTMTTNFYIRGVKRHDWPRFQKRLWQRNYFERVIRNKRELQAIRRYIKNNPTKWLLDKPHGHDLPGGHTGPPLHITH